MVPMIKNYMSLLKFNNYNKDKKRIDNENRMGIALILAYYSVIVLLNLISILLTSSGYVHSRSISVDLILVFCALPLLVIIRKKKDLNYTALIYLVEITILLITIWHGTFEDPSAPTITFLLCLIVLPELIMDKPYRIILFTVAIAAVYCLFDVAAKTPDLYTRDLLHAINAGLISISVTLYVMAVRIQNNNYIDGTEDRAERDPLTGLYNRYGAQVHFKKNEPGLLVFMDLDDFKKVNDRLGHEQGDFVLRETARALQSCFRGDDILIRLGGDEFAVFAPGTWTQTAIQKKLAEALHSVNDVHPTGGERGADADVTASIGCVYAPNGAEELDSLIRAADVAMYRVKKTGKNDYAFDVLDDGKDPETR